MIEHLFGLVKSAIAGSPPSAWREIQPESPPIQRNSWARPGVYSHMKRDSHRLVAATLRTGFMVGLALILILILLPAALAAQAAGLR
jgi:hypothetical protein